MNQAKQAIEACALVAQQNPAELRYEYQMARAMEAEVPEKAVAIHKKLAGQGYPAAYDNLGWLMVKLEELWCSAYVFQNWISTSRSRLDGQSRGNDR